MVRQKKSERLKSRDGRWTEAGAGVARQKQGKEPAALKQKVQVISNSDALRLCSGGVACLLPAWSMKGSSLTTGQKG